MIEPIKEDLHAIIEIKEVKDYKKANEYLNLGWQLINLYTDDYGHPKNVHQWTVYCLGWKKDNGEVVHPKGGWD